MNRMDKWPIGQIGQIGSGILAVGITWLYMEISHRRYEKSIIDRFAINIPSGPSPSYKKRIDLLIQLEERAQIMDFDNFLLLGNKLPDNPIIRTALPEIIFHTLLHYVSAIGPGSESDDFLHSSHEFAIYTDRVWKIVQMIYTNKPHIDPFIDPVRRKSLLAGTAPKPRITRTYDDIIPSHDTAISMSVRHQYWVVHKSTQLAVRFARLVVGMTSSFSKKCVRINGYNITFWYKPPSTPVRGPQKVLLFFHGAALGGLTFYFDALWRICPPGYHLICYEIPNMAELDFRTPYPGIDILYRSIIEVMKTVLNANRSIEWSIMGHSLGCDSVSSIVQYLSGMDIGRINGLDITRGSVILIEPFCNYASNSLRGRQIAWRCPEKFPARIWSFAIGNLYTQLAIKRSISTSHLIWIMPTDISWTGWKSKHIITSERDKSVTSQSIAEWVDTYSELGWTHGTIPGNHGGWVTQSKPERYLKLMLADIIN
jgi:hypothetical protein